MKAEFDKNNYIVIKKAVEPKIAEINTTLFYFILIQTMVKLYLEIKKLIRKKIKL